MREDDGWVNGATNFPGPPDRCRRSGCRVWLAHGAASAMVRIGRSVYAERRKRRDNLQCRWMFLLPCRAEPAGSTAARRRRVDPLAIRYLLYAEHLARSR